MAMVPMNAWSSSNSAYAGGGAWPMPMEVDDGKLRKRVGWLNKNGFENALIFDKVKEAAMGVDTKETMEILKDLEEKKQQVKDPTAWVSNALRKRKPAQAQFAMAPQFASPATGAYFMGADMGGDTDAVLRKKIGWLNSHGGFENQVNYQKISEAAAGVDSMTALNILEDLAKNKAKVNDPTAYVAHALRKAGGGRGGAGKYPTPSYGAPAGVKRSIMKNKGPTKHEGIIPL